MLDASLPNGVHINGNVDEDVDVLPADTQSPPPTSPSDNADVKVGVDTDVAESDARDIPPPALSLKLDAVEDASHVPQVGTPADPGQCISFHVTIQSF